MEPSKLFMFNPHTLQDCNHPVRLSHNLLSVHEGPFLLLTHPSGQNSSVFMVCLICNSHGCLSSHFHLSGCRGECWKSGMPELHVSILGISLITACCCCCCKTPLPLQSHRKTSPNIPEGQTRLKLCFEFWCVLLLPTPRVAGKGLMKALEPPQQRNNHIQPLSCCLPQGVDPGVIKCV